MAQQHRKEKYVPALSFDVLTPLYDVVVALTSRERAFKRELVGQSAGVPARSILDLGCGTGTLTIALKRVHPEAEVFGLDGDSRILERARRKAKDAKISVVLDEGMSFEMPYPDGSFDLVVSSLFFHHLTPEDKRRTLTEASRVLRPQGHLHVADWGLPSNLLMRIASRPVQWFDGATTEDSFSGRLPALISDTGFDEIAETASFDTMFGTIRLLRATRK